MERPVISNLPPTLGSNNGCGGCGAASKRVLSRTSILIFKSEGEYFVLFQGWAHLQAPNLVEGVEAYVDAQGVVVGVVFVIEVVLQLSGKGPKEGG